jgi:hypothetical protein
VLGPVAAAGPVVRAAGAAVGPAGAGAVVLMSREFRWLARELRPRPVRERSVPAAVLGWVFRYLPELGLLAGLVWLWAALASRLGSWPALVVLVAGAGLLVWWPASRRVLTSALGCALTHHRLRTALIELRLSSRAGRLPLVLWLGPTPVGERVWLWCRAGMSAEDLADETDRLRSACVARDVRVTRDRRWSALVTLDVIRRDPLGSAQPVRSPLADVGDADG